MIDRSSFGDMTAIVYRLRRANGRTERHVKSGRGLTASPLLQLLRFQPGFGGHELTSGIDAREQDGSQQHRRRDQP